MRPVSWDSILIISLEKAKKPKDYHEAIIRMGELGVLPPKFARGLAPIAGFRNILVHEYLSVDWDEVYKQLNPNVAKAEDTAPPLLSRARSRLLRLRP